MLRRFHIDAYMLALMGVVLLASVLPCRGEAAVIIGFITKAAIVLLFAMHGAKLSRQAILQGIGAWKLQLMTLAGTFALFPLLGLLVQLVPDTLLSPTIKMGLLFLTLLPSTVQSSIAFTSIAGGNVAAAVCAASLSNLLGIFITPLLVSLLIVRASDAPDLSAALVSVVLTLLVPFFAGHLSRPVTAGFVHRHKQMLSLLDRGAILLVVYSAFSAAVVEGLWRRVAGSDLVLIVVASTMLLAIAIAMMRLWARLTGLSRADEVTLVFCGSKKSLASGVPIAAALFPAAQIGIIILPLMLFHQIQLMVCAVLARRYRSQADAQDAMEAPHNPPEPRAPESVQPASCPPSIVSTVPVMKRASSDPR